jgi:hypothetical protein
MPDDDAKVVKDILGEALEEALEEVFGNALTGIRQEVVATVRTLRDGIIDGDTALLEVIKALIIKVDRLEKEFEEYRHNQQYPPVH